MNRKNSRARAERAWRLRCAGRTWQQIADAENFKTRGAAYRAVHEFLKRNPPDDVITSRLATAEGLRMVQTTLFEALIDAKRARDNRAVVSIASAIQDNLDKQAKLMGLHISAPTQVNVTVQSAAEIISDARSRLLAAIDADDAGVIDGEVVGEPAPKALGR